MLTTYQKQAKMKLATTIITIVVIAGVVVIVDYLNSNSTASSAAANTNLSPTSAPTTAAVPDTPTSDDTSTTNPQPETTPAITTPTNASGYKDGTYTSTSDYFVPHGSESIRVTLALANGLVTDVSVQNSENNRTSAQYQESFAAGYKSVVVGQKITGLQVGAIAGASDTAQGFNNALDQIAAQAQA